MKLTPELIEKYYQNPGNHKFFQLKERNLQLSILRNKDWYWRVCVCRFGVTKRIYIGKYPYMSYDQAIAVSKIINERIKAKFFNIEDFLKLYFNFSVFFEPKKKKKKKRVIKILHPKKYGKYRKKYDLMYRKKITKN